MANTAAQVVYSGALYADAGNVAKASGRKLEDIIAEANSTVKNVAAVKDRRAAFLETMTVNNVESDIDGYIATQSAYMAFCNRFFLDSKKYLLDLKKVIAEGRKIEKPITSVPTATAVRNSKVIDEIVQVGELLDILVEEQKNTNKLLQSLVSNAAMVQMDTRENMESLHKIGPKLGEIDKKLKNIEVGVSTVAKAWPGHVANLANLKTRIDRWMTR